MLERLSISYYSSTVYSKETAGGISSCGEVAPGVSTVA
jgi:hypothetical protein